MTDARPQCIQKSAETEGRDEHQDHKLHQHSSKRKNHQIILQSDKC